MGFGGAMLALSAVQGISSIGQGIAQNQEDKYNAELYAEKAQTIQIQGQIQQGQMTRQGSQLLSTATAKAGGAGLNPTGSVAATMLSTQTQVDTDKAIAQYNNTLQYNAANQQANKSNDAVMSGVSGAFSDLLKGVVSYGLYSGKGGSGGGSGSGINLAGDQQPDFSPLQLN